MVQACMYIEHRTRCLVLKAAVDMIMHKRNDTLRPSRVLGVPREVLLPPSFQRFVENHSATDAIQCYPQLWQNYIFGWGGFLITDRLDREYANLAMESGLPVTAVKNALDAFDELFPIKGKRWHYDKSAAGTQLLKMVPAPFRGLGVVRRHWIYGNDFKSNLPELARQDFMQWQDAGYRLLKSDSR